MCLELFAKDTNALIANEEKNIENFWECLSIFCRASGSNINHTKRMYIFRGKNPSIMGFQSKMLSNSAKSHLHIARDTMGGQYVSCKGMEVGPK